MAEPRPVRLQLSRRKGLGLQALSYAINGLDAVNCARPGKFGNPFVVGARIDVRQAKRWGWKIDFPDSVAPDNETAVRRFALCVALDDASIAEIRRLLRGKNLACWCKSGEPCHADVLLELANAPALDAAEKGEASSPSAAPGLR